MSSKTVDITIYYKSMGGHTHMRVFVNGGKSGDLVVQNEEFQAFRHKFAITVQWYQDQ